MDHEAVPEERPDTGQGRRSRRVPPWLPLALAVAFLLLYLVQGAIPRESETADTVIEAVPFVLAGLALLLVPFTRPSALRNAGMVALLVVLTSPVWWPAYLGVVSDLTRDDPKVLVTIEITSEEGVSYELWFPLPEDQKSIQEPLIQDLLGESGTRLERLNGTWLVVSGEGPRTLTARATYPERDGSRTITLALPEKDAHAWSEGPLTATFRIDIHDVYCGGSQEYHVNVDEAAVVTTDHDDLEMTCS